MRRRRIATIAVATVALLVGALFGARAVARSRTFQLFGRLVAEVATRDSVVALTFDDGPVDAMADTIIATLRSRGVRATFFVTGAELSKAPSAGTRLVAAGQELGNHSFSHNRMLFTSGARIRDEIERTDALVRAAGGTGPILFRPPFGYKLIGLPWFLSRTGRTTIMWSIEPDSYPEVAGSAERIVAHVLGRVRPGSIILLHVWYPSRRTSRDAVGPLIDSLHARGYRVVPAGALLQGGSQRFTSGTPIIVTTGIIRP